MPERPPIRGRGKVLAERLPGRLYDLEMPNGFRTLGVVPKEGPLPPEQPLGRHVTLAFSPFDLGHGRITAWDGGVPEEAIAAPPTTLLLRKPMPD